MPRANFLVLLIGVLLSGCATMSQDACQTADWRSLGYADGANGSSMEKFNKRELACSKHAIVPDRKDYELGRSDGLDTYCVPDTGFELGESGGRYSGICSGRDENQFLAAFDLGRNMHAFNTAVNSAKSALSRDQKRYEKLGQKLDKYRTGYRDEGVSTDEHNANVLEIWAERRYLQDESILYWSYASRFLTEQRDSFEVALAVSDPEAATMQPRRFPGPEKFAGATADDARAMLQEVFRAAAR